jgi:transcriptional regulator with XRE-family HTH domain
MVKRELKRASRTEQEQSAKKITESLSARIQKERRLRDWSIQDLADRSGVSRAMISKIERREASPTAVTLSCLGAALGLSMSSLLADEEAANRRVSRKEEQQVWLDPATGYSRRAVSPAAGMPLQLVDVTLPAGVKIDFPAISYAILHQQIWILRGRLLFLEGGERHDLKVGDCLQLAGASDCTFENPSQSMSCRYVVALIVGR